MVGSAVRQPRARQVDADADHEGGDAHHQRQVEAVPHGQAVFGKPAAQHRQRGDVEHPADGSLRRHADHQAGQHQQLDRQAHPADGFMRLFGRGAGVFRADEHIEHKTQCVGHAERAGQRRGDGQQPFHPGGRGDEGRLGEEHFLRQETVQQRHAGHRRTRHDGQGAGDGHGPPQARELADVAGAGFMVHDAGGHEKRGLEDGVVQDVEHRGQGGGVAVEAEQQGDQAQVRQRGIGQQALQVVLEKGRPCADQQRGEPGAADHPEPGVGARQHRPETRQQEHAGLHQGGRMQVGRHRRRGGHGLRQPEVERELRALGERAQQHQHQHRQIQRMGADLVACRQDDVEVVAADDVAHQQQPGQQAQAAHAGHQQRIAGAAAGVLAVVPVADQQEREQAGQFPEKRQHHQVARQHHAGHRAHEGQHEGVEPGHRVFRRKVVAGIQRHQRADAVDEHAEQPREAVHAQAEIEAGGGNPLDLFPQHRAGTALHGEREMTECTGGEHCATQRQQTCEQGPRVACPGRQYGCDQAASEGEGQQCGQQHRAVVMEGVVGTGIRSLMVGQFCVSRATKNVKRPTDETSVGLFGAVRRRGRRQVRRFTCR